MYLSVKVEMFNFNYKFMYVLVCKISDCEDFFWNFKFWFINIKKVIMICGKNYIVLKGRRKG